MAEFAPELLTERRKCSLYFREDWLRAVGIGYRPFSLKVFVFVRLGRGGSKCQHAPTGGREEDERAVSRTICAAQALTTRKMRESVFGREEAL